MFLWIVLNFLVLILLAYVILTGLYQVITYSDAQLGNGRGRLFGQVITYSIHFGKIVLPNRDLTKQTFFFHFLALTLYFFLVVRSFQTQLPMSNSIV